MLRDEQERKSASPEEDALWQRHLSGKDPAATSALVERYQPIARKIAATFYGRRHDNSVEFNDYLQSAHVGLLEAIDRYDPAREASFETYASYRIRGAILNQLDKATEVASQKAQRRRLRRERLQSLKERVDTRARNAFLQLVDITLYLAIGHLLEESRAGEANDDSSAEEPYKSLEIKQVQKRLAQLVATLPEREQCIIRYHYFEHKEFVEIGALIGISKGRVSQLHARALKLLREHYRAQGSIDRTV